jgi:hypothetical protein
VRSGLSEDQTQTVASSQSSIPQAPGGGPISAFESGNLIYLGEKTGKFWPRATSLHRFRCWNG